MNTTNLQRGSVTATWLIGIIIVVLIAWFGFSERDGKEMTDLGTEDMHAEAITLGALLPLTGPTGIWGTELQRGLELAREDLGAEAEVVIVYEDSQGSSAEGVSAFTKLVQSDDVDVVMSALSRVTMPLVPLAESNQVPLIMTMVSAQEAVTESNPYTFRTFFPANDLGSAYSDIFAAEGYESIALLTLNDEFGNSVADVIEDEMERLGIDLVRESYLPQDTDYRTQITKMKSVDPDAAIFVGIPPIALANFLIQSEELGFDVPVFESSGILQSPGSREAVGEIGDGVHSIATTFDLGETGASVHEEYRARYDTTPSFATGYGYDIMTLLVEQVRSGNTSRQAITDGLTAYTTFTGVHGEYVGDGFGELNPEIFPSQMQDGAIMRVE